MCRDILLAIVLLEMINCFIIVPIKYIGYESYMPEISRFFGIIVAMYYKEHNPPHFHVRYNEYKAAISIKELKVLKGKLPPRVLGLVIEWATTYQAELMEDWQLAETLQALKPIKPLE